MVRVLPMPCLDGNAWIYVSHIVDVIWPLQKSTPMPKRRDVELHSERFDIRSISKICSPVCRCIRHLSVSRTDLLVARSQLIMMAMQKRRASADSDAGSCGASGTHCTWPSGRVALRATAHALARVWLRGQGISVANARCDRSVPIQSRCCYLGSRGMIAAEPGADWPRIDGYVYAFRGSVREGCGTRLAARWQYRCSCKLRRVVLI